jgi:hypothetical protein
MAVHFHASNFRTHLAAGALIAVLAATMPHSSRADELEASRQTCDNVKANPDERIPACTRLLSMHTQFAPHVQ